MEPKHSNGRGCGCGCLLCLLIGFAAGIYVGTKRGIPFVGTERGWAISIYTGPTPFDLNPLDGVNHPMITNTMATDMDAEFVADPFMVRRNNTWYLFFEALDRPTKQGDIAYATSDDGLTWTYGARVLDEPFHLSYPQVFEVDGTYFMIPECGEEGCIKLYRAKSFPDQWVFEQDLIEGAYADPSVFRHDGRWWMFAHSGAGRPHAVHGRRPDRSVDDAPEESVIASDLDISRPGGRVIEFEGDLYRFTQDLQPTYGNQVRARSASPRSPPPSTRKNPSTPIPW
jgi:hypothetical protein